MKLSWRGWSRKGVFLLVGCTQNSNCYHNDMIAFQIVMHIRIQIVSLTKQRPLWHLYYNWVISFFHFISRSGNMICHWESVSMFPLLDESTFHEIIEIWHVFIPYKYILRQCFLFSWWLEQAIIQFDKVGSNYQIVLYSL